MHDDPTRMMGRPEDPHHRPHGNMRLVIAGLVAVIVGLVIALIVVANDNGGETASTPPELTTPPATETTSPTTTTTTEPTTTTTTEPTTTETTTSPETGEEGGSGGVEAP
jgi:cytoskeletal protein RodZ